MIIFLMNVLKEIKSLLAKSLDNCVDSCLSLTSLEVADTWDFDVDVVENFSRRRRRSLFK